MGEAATSQRGRKPKLGPKVRELARKIHKPLNGQKKIVRPLDTLAGVRMEMARQYRRAAAGELEAETMVRLVSALDKIRGVIEAETAPNAAGRELRITLRSSTNEQLIIPSINPSMTIEHEMQPVIDATEESVDPASDNPKD